MKRSTGILSFLVFAFGFFVMFNVHETRAKADTTDSLSTFTFKLTD